MLNLALANLIKEKRISSNMKQAALASTLNVNQSAISRIENGFQEPNLEQLYLLCVHLDISIDKLFKEFKTTKSHKD